MDELDNKLFTCLSNKIKAPLKYEYVIKNALNNEEKFHKYRCKSIMKILATTCAGIILTAGVVFAVTNTYQSILSLRAEVKDNTPSLEECKYAKEKMCEGIQDNLDYLEVYDGARRSFRHEHMMLESILLNETEELKNPTSERWNYHETEIYTNCLNIMIEVINEENEKIKNQQIKNDLNRFSNLLKEALKTHNVEYCYEAHKILHDYDLFCVNYDSATEEEVIEPISVHEYYGSISVIEELRNK